MNSPATPVQTSIRIDHVMIGVHDYPKILDFYVHTLGFQIDQEWTLDDMPGRQLAYLSLGDFRIELISGGVGLRAPVPEDFAAHFENHGFQHLCLSTPDVDALHAELVQRGVPVLLPPTDFPPPVNKRLAFLKDPEGNVLELATDL